MNEIRNVSSLNRIKLAPNKFNKKFKYLFHLQKYKDLDGEIVRKNGIILLRELTNEVKNFMDFKMNAVLVRIIYAKMARIENFVISHISHVKIKKVFLQFCIVRNSPTIHCILWLWLCWCV